jgi:hypothetical protein
MVFFGWELVLGGVLGLVAAGIGTYTAWLVRKWLHIEK